MLSVSEEGISRIEVLADDNATAEEFRKLYNTVENAISEIDNLPKDIEGKPSMDELQIKKLIDENVHKMNNDYDEYKVKSKVNVSPPPGGLGGFANIYK